MGIVGTVVAGGNRTAEQDDVEGVDDVAVMDSAEDVGEVRRGAADHAAGDGVGLDDPAPITLLASHPREGLRL